MNLFFSSAGRPTLAWLGGFLLLALGWLQPQVARASHLRAGDIQARVDTLPGRSSHYYFRMTLYRDRGGVVLDDATVYFGDNTRLDRIGAALNGAPGTTRTVVLDAASNTDIITFTFDHTYSAPATYTVSYIGENRNKDVVNMANSDTQTLYLATVITVNPAYGINHSPVLRAPAIDQAAVGQVWLHNPAAYDADGDSLAYKLIKCQQVMGGPTAAISNNNMPQPVVCTGYVYPSDPSITPTAYQVAFAGTPGQGIPAGITSPPTLAIIVQDAYNGQITWNAPSRVGQYNIAFVVEEWRRTPFGRIQIGSVIRDMQILVSATPNTPPSLTVPPDLCVVAGTALSFTVSAVDGSGPNNPASNVTLQAYSGILPPATFTQNNQGPSVTGTFSWTPDCRDVANQPYVVLFKAQDTPPNAGVPILIDEKPVRVRVIGPAPQNVQVVTAPGIPRLTNVVSWSRYACQNASQLFIYRKENAGPGPGACETGIPAAWGYVRIGAVPATATSFADDNAGAGLARGKTYCYRLYAGFALPAGGASVASAEACATVGGRAARLKNVDVDVTSGTSGQITVRWTPPRPTSAGVPYVSPGYVLARGEGLAPTSFVPVATLVGLQDSSYVDTGLDTQGKQYTYQLTFTYVDASTGSAQTVRETVPVASSVRVRVSQPGAGTSLALSWTYNVPWDNSKQPTRVFRDSGNGSGYTQVGVASSGAAGGSFTDTGLSKGQTYCYYVETNGQYADATAGAGLAYLSNLRNKSQQACAPLLDIPCTPVLSIAPLNCDSLSARGTVVGAQQRYVNKLRWTLGTDPAGCGTAVAYYRVLRATTSAGPFVALDSVAGLTYADRNLSQPTYCYQVQAVSAAGARSAVSNAACQQDCFFFELPNVFTPNGDGVNDTFRPKSASGVLRTHIALYNRWGRKVYESDQYPYIDWAGGGQAGESSTSGMVTDGLYYFLAEVTFADGAQTTRVFKGWVQLIR